VKKSLELELDVSEFAFDFEPGDSIGIVCKNKKKEVDYLIERMDISEQADKQMTLQVMENTTKKSACVPTHFRRLPCTLRTILMEFVDFRSVPRKAFIRMLVDYTTDTDEKRRLQELCSVQGGSDYSNFVRGKYIGLVQLLQTFPSCTPPIARVLELLPQLLPREYSIASYAGKQDSRFKFVFNVIELPSFQNNDRLGLCTSWLDSLTYGIRSSDIEEGMQSLALNSASSETPPEEKLKSVTMDGREQIRMYFRRPTGFRFPTDPTKPLIMIGPGTGVAPFIGFLEKREHLLLEDPTIPLSTALLFFGCRYRGKDELYREELLEFKSKGVLTELYTSYSREEIVEESHTKYVQHNIRAQKELVLKLLFEQDGLVYVCGDAKFMGRDVTNTFVELIEEYKNLSKPDAIAMMKEMQEKKQFLEDVWT